MPDISETEFDQSYGPTLNDASMGQVSVLRPSHVCTQVEDEEGRGWLVNGIFSSMPGALRPPHHSQVSSCLQLRRTRWERQQRNFVGHRPARPPAAADRADAGMAILKHTFDLSDEVLCGRRFSAMRCRSIARR